MPAGGGGDGAGVSATARGSSAKSAASDGGLDDGFRRLKIGYSVTLPVSVSVPCRSRFAIGVAVRCLGITAEVATLPFAPHYCKSESSAPWLSDHQPFQNSAYSAGVSVESRRGIYARVCAVQNGPLGPPSGILPCLSAKSVKSPKNEAARSCACGSLLSRSSAIAGSTSLVRIFANAAAAATSTPRDVGVGFDQFLQRGN